MPTIRTLQRLVLAGALSLITSFALAGNGSPPPPPPSSSGNNDDTDAVLMVVTGLAIGTSINCASTKPLIPGLCTLLGWE